MLRVYLALWKMDQMGNSCLLLAKELFLHQNKLLKVAGFNPQIIQFTYLCTKNWFLPSETQDVSFCIEKYCT